MSGPTKKELLAIIEGIADWYRGTPQPGGSVKTLSEVIPPVLKLFPDPRVEVAARAGAAARARAEQLAKS